MHKKTLSVVLCLAMLLSMFAMMPANAAITDETNTGAQTNALPAGARTVESPDDFSWDNANVYFLLTDRFYNGNTSNDHSYGRATDASGNALSGWQSCPGTFHGGDFAGITKKLEEGYFDKLGVNAIWISAPYEQIHGYVTTGDGFDFAHYSYHGYYVLDYTEPDKNFGTKAEFKTMVETAHKHGVRVVCDIVMNHAGYNTVKDMIEFNFGTFKDQNAAKSYMYKLNGCKGLHDHVNYSATTSDWGRWWGSSWIRSGLPGYSEQKGSDLTDCLAGLPDFRTESGSKVSIPTFLKNKWTKEGTLSTKNSKFGTSNTVSDFISSWLADWVETYGIDGFRCDTAKHVEMASWKKLKTKCSAALKKWRQNNPTATGANWDEDFWMTGEHWDHKLDKDGYYSNGFDSMINFSFSGAGVPDKNGIGGTYQNYANAINNDPNFNVLTYISSHDTNLARGDMYWQGSAFQLLPGGIQPFYGDESGRKLVSNMNSDAWGAGHCLRSDMNWNSMDNNLLAHWQKVGTFRRNHVAVGAGKHATVSASSGYAFSRRYDDGVTTDEIIAVIGANNNTNVDITVSSIWGNGTIVTNAYDGKTAEVKNGKVTFNSGAHGTILLEGPRSTISMSLNGKTLFKDTEKYTTVTVSLRGADYAMASINGGTAFRVTNGSTFKVGENVTVPANEKSVDIVVKMTASNSEETLEKSFTFTKKNSSMSTTVYFDNSSYNWGSTIYAYIYDDSSSEVKENAAWPGKAMSVDSATGYYYVDVPDDPDDLTNGKVIFSGSGGRYPAEMEPGLPIGGQDMIFMAGNKWVSYPPGNLPSNPTKPTTTQPDPSTTTTVYFRNSGFSNPTIYCWKKNTEENVQAWPGSSMQKYKDNVYKFTFSNKYNCCIFSDNGGNKTDDLDIPGNNYIYSNGSWSKYADAEVVTTPTSATVPTQPGPSVTVLIGDANQDSQITIKDATSVQYHAASLRTLTGAAFHAADANQDGDVSIKDATMIQYYVAQMKNNNSKCGQTKTIGGGNTPTQPQTQPTAATTPTTPTQGGSDPNKVYFRNDARWSPVKAYFWSDDNLQMMSWPGNNMQSEGNNIYSATIPAGANHVIFTKGDDSGKTPDLDLQAGRMYANGSWMDVPSNTNPPQPGGKVYFRNSANWSPVKAYFWSDDEPQMMSWPGNDMTSEGGNVYSAEIPAGATKVIFTKGDDSGKTADLDLQAGQIYDNGSWSSYSG